MKQYYLIIIAFIFISCNNKNKTETKSVNNTSATKTESTHKGAKIVKQLCTSCHNPSGSEKSRIAPPLVAIKAHYINENTTKDEFIKELKSFLKNPTKDKAKLRGAVKRFGVMPLTPLTDKQIEQVGEYLFDYEIPEPKWFKEHWQERKGKSYINKGKKSANVDVKKSPADIGLEYALGTKKVLGKNLMGTIQKKGTLEALQFCNEKAYPLTDSMAVKFNATIKRVSDKPRNIKNKATVKEVEIINQYKKMVADKSDIKPITETIDGKTQFYYPIVTNSMCLQCHGTPNKQIKPVTLEKLAMLYPKDKAQNYDVNQVRGIWNITFKN